MSEPGMYDFTKTAKRERSRAGGWVRPPRPRGKAPMAQRQKAKSQMPSPSPLGSGNRVGIGEQSKSQPASADFHEVLAFRGKIITKSVFPQVALVFASMCPSALARESGWARIGAQAVPAGRSWEQLLAAANRPFPLPPALGATFSLFRPPFAPDFWGSRKEFALPAFGFPSPEGMA